MHEYTQKYRHSLAHTQTRTHRHSINKYTNSYAQTHGYKHTQVSNADSSRAPSSWQLLKFESKETGNRKKGKVFKVTRRKKVL